MQVAAVPTGYRRDAEIKAIVRVEVVINSIPTTG